MYDRFNREINYLRISVTDRCNLRCLYCMPAGGIRLISHNEILSYEEMIAVVKEAVKLGISRVRITGGEPLVRKGIVQFVEMLAKTDGILDLGLTTNGTLLAKYAKDLVKAGLHRINISLDTVDRDKFSQITRGGNIDDVFEGIDAAKKAGLTPVKINCVVRNSSSEPDAAEVRDFCRKNDLEARFIHEMNLETGCFALVENGDGGNCVKCNRLRLTANGWIKPCLFNDLAFSIREYGIREALLKAIESKPEKGLANTNDLFHFIGG
ncbi:MAG: radical SAM protein [Bacteroidetes bacterium]|nr:radical SAM protein [Bacteroidota bacterium]